jgi:hypothetical protein
MNRHPRKVRRCRRPGRRLVDQRCQGLGRCSKAAAAVAGVVGRSVAEAHPTTAAAVLAISTPLW